MLAKLENGVIRFAYGNILRYGNNIVVNPREIDYINARYKEIIDNRLPDRQGYNQIPEYSETDENIVINYRYEEANEEIDV